ncbi:HesB/IscA family protein [Aerosakkonema sp. BLCC-F183]|uniref:HesB/IscA family protein n=1 Tax=Aerosakkonema sp. BLCC-F183 TaxID=3342834 RepID=UPI0035B8B742
MINISKAAASEVKRLKSKLKKPNALFRLKINAGGCAGLLYAMEFDDAIAPDDIIYDCNGLQVIIPADNCQYVEGLTLDYSEDLMGGGFRFHNPNATQTCGCGNSFSVKPTSGAALNMAAPEQTFDI